MHRETDRACGTHETHEKPLSNVSPKMYGKPVINPAVDGRYYKNCQTLDTMKRRIAAISMFFYCTTLPHNENPTSHLLSLNSETEFSAYQKMKMKRISPKKISARKGLNEYQQRNGEHTHGDVWTIRDRRS